MLLFSHKIVSDSFRDPMDCSLPGFSVHGISQAGILEWVAIFFSNHKVILEWRNHSGIMKLYVYLKPHHEINVEAKILK